MGDALAASGAGNLGRIQVVLAEHTLHERAQPVFADITSEDDWNISPEDVKEKICSRTKAVIVLHYGGYAADMNAFEVNGLSQCRSNHAASGDPIEEHKTKCETKNDAKEKLEFKAKRK